jgi:hypothetical protein
MFPDLSIRNAQLPAVPGRVLGLAQRLGGKRPRPGRHKAISAPPPGSGHLRKTEIIGAVQDKLDMVQLPRAIDALSICPLEQSAAGSACCR